MRIKFWTFTEISLKLTLLYAMIFSIVLIALNGCIFYTLKYYLYSEASRQIRSTNKTVMNELIKPNRNNTKSLYDDNLFNQILLDANVSVNIVNYNYYIINTSANKYINRIPLEAPYNKVRYVKTGKDSYLYIDNLVKSADNKVLYTQIFKDMKNETKFLNMLFYLMALATCAGVIISFFVGFLISKKMLKPIDKITKTAQSISIQGLNKRIEIEGANDELKRLAETFNNMISRLEEAFEKQNQFVSNASHELRTPIAVINGYINMLDRWGKDDKEILKESITVIKNETDNMAELIEKMLFLARGDVGNLKINAELFSLNDLIDELVNESKMLSPSHHIFSTAKLPISFSGDKKMIKQMLRALVHNSIKFTPTGGEIEIMLSKNSSSSVKDMIEILVRDTGIGIPSEDIPNIFDRFYRVNKSRTDDKGGTGLGLSIVKQIVTIHNGTIQIKSSLNVGTEISIKLPEIKNI